MISQVVVLSRLVQICKYEEPENRRKETTMAASSGDDGEKAKPFQLKVEATLLASPNFTSGRIERRKTRDAD